MSKEDFSQPYTPQERQAMRAIEKEMAPLIFPRKLKRKDKRTGKYERTGFAENSSQFAKFKKLSAKHAAIGSERIAPKTPDTIERLANDAKHLLSGGLQMHRAIAGETDASKQSMAGVVQAMYDRAYRLDTSSPARPVAVLMTFAETKGAIEQLQRWCLAAISKPLASNAKPATRATVRPTDAEVDAVLANLGINGQEYKPHTWHEFTSRNITGNNLKNAKCKGEIIASDTRGDHGENLYLVRRVVWRFFSKFQS